MTSRDERIANETLRSAKGCLVCERVKDRSGIIEWSIGIYEPPREQSLLPGNVEYVSYLLCPSCAETPGVTAEAEARIIAQVGGKSH